MRFRRKFFGILVCIFGLSLIFPLILPLFNLVESSGKISESYKLFPEFKGLDTRFKALNKIFQPAFANMTSIVAIIAISLYGLFLLFFILQLSRKGRLPYRAILKSISVTMFLISIIAITCTIAFIISNKIVFENRTLLSFEYGLGSWLLTIGSGVAGLCGIISQAKYRRKF